jgi:IMP dehydrogenase
METVCGKEMAQTLNNLGGLGFIHRFNSITEQCNELPVTGLKAAAIGVSGDWWERAVELVKMGTHIILIDVAHGHHLNVKNALLKLKSEFPNVDFIAGNVATGQGYLDLVNWGADGVRVGLGNGSLCETRIRTGIGVPQVSALISSYLSKYKNKLTVPIIADGGIRFVGDAAKALSIGASTVMLGSLLAGTKESPGKIQTSGQWPDETKYKSYRGSASLESKMLNNLPEKNIEGNSKIIPYKGKVHRIITDIIQGIQSSMSYVNAKTLTEFVKNSNIITVSPAGQIEAQPHLLNK